MKNWSTNMAFSSSPSVNMDESSKYTDDVPFYFSYSIWMSFKNHWTIAVRPSLAYSSWVALGGLCFHFECI